MFADIYLRNGPTGLERRPRFLDFACGCGRIARYMQAWDCDLFACDMNPQLVEWCQSHLLETSTIQNQRNPPLDYPDGYFDFVYAYSVFTHTSEAATREWIHELRRVLIPGSLLAFTTNGSHWIDSVSKLAPVLKRMNLSVEELADAKSRVEQGEFVSHVYSGSPDGYGLALTSLGRIADSWVSSEFELVDQIPGGANHSQDMSVFRAK
jgi:SAM-dependent methyltransferase